MTAVAGGWQKALESVERQGRWWVLLLVFALSLVETFLANRTYR